MLTVEPSLLDMSRHVMAAWPCSLSLSPCSIIHIHRIETRRPTGQGAGPPPPTPFPHSICAGTGLHCTAARGRHIDRPHLALFHFHYFNLYRSVLYDNKFHRNPLPLLFHLPSRRQWMQPICRTNCSTE